MLHIIDDFPIDAVSLEKTSSGDTIIFTENAVYAAKITEPSFRLLQKAFAHLNFCVLETDLKQRGVSFKDIQRNIPIIDEDDFQDIKENSMAIKSWN
jgi:sulfur relay protein TusB/DsrH